MSDERGHTGGSGVAAGGPSDSSIAGTAAAPGGLDLPALYVQADANAQRSQRRYQRLLGAQLIFALVCSSCGVFTSFTKASWPGYVSAGASLVIVLLRMWQRSTHADTAWYDARATAERVKSLTWRYVTRTNPFGPELADQAANSLLLDRLRDAAGEAHTLSPGPGQQQITASMRALRTAEVTERADAYKRDRLADQLRWYMSRAHSAHAAAERWEVAFFVFASATLLAGILLASAGVNLVGLFAALASVVLSWAGGRSYAALSRAYDRAALDVSLASEGVKEIRLDHELAEFVSTVEAMLTGEHERWRMARQ